MVCLKIGNVLYRPQVDTLAGNYNGKLRPKHGCGGLAFCAPSTVHSEWDCKDPSPGYVY